MAVHSKHPFGLCFLALAMFLGTIRAASAATAVPDDPASKVEKVLAEIRQIYARYLEGIPAGSAWVFGTIYARYSTRHQDSIPDQVRALLFDALQRQIYVPFEFIFFDLSVRGVKFHRAGLNALRECLAKRSIQVVLFFATNRLFRKTYRSLQFVEEQIIDRGIRAVFVKSGVDTADGKRWRSLLNMHAMMDEFVVSMYVDNIRAAHEGLMEQCFVFGTIAFGYRGEPIPCELTRRGRPRRKIVIDEFAAHYVRLIFQWYVKDRLSIVEIVRRLNSDPNCPKPPKSRIGRWTRQSVVKVLRNTRYRGLWHYGMTESVWISSKDYSRQIERSKPLKELTLEDLRLVNDDEWYAAAARLDQEIAKFGGRKIKDGDRQSRPRLLNGLFVCEGHKQILYTGGAHGKWMICKDCRDMPAADRPLFSFLPRALALKKTCEAIAKLIHSNDQIPDRIIEVCQRHVAQQQVPDPLALSALRTRRNKLEQRIAFILDNPGDTDSDRGQSASVLRKLRSERTAVAAKQAALEAATQGAIEVPSREAVIAMLADLSDLLKAAVKSDEKSGLVRELIDLCTGGKIELVQRGERIAQRGWLEGRFVNRLANAVTKRLTGVAIGSDADSAEVITIVYRQDLEPLCKEKRTAVIAMYQAGALVKDIARKTGVNRNRVTTVLKDWSLSQGIPWRDGRSRRGGLIVKHLEPPMYQVIADKAKELADTGLLLIEVADQLGIDRNTVTSALRYWHESRGLTPPDGRARRKSLVHKTLSSHPKD